MPSPHARIIIESLHELEEIAQELRESNFTLSFRFDRLAEFAQRLQHIQSRWQNVQNSLDLNNELRADILLNYLDEIERIDTLIKEITMMIEKRDWVRNMTRTTVVIGQIISGLIEIGRLSLDLLELVHQSDTQLASNLQSSVEYLQAHLMPKLLSA